MASFSAYKKRREVLALGVEATPGATAAKQHVFPYLTENLRSIPGVLENESADGTNRRVNDSAMDVAHSEGSVGGKVTANNFSLLAYGMFSKVDTVDNADGTYTHTLSRDDSVARKSFSAWKVTPAGTRLFKSLFLDSLNLSIETSDAGGWLQSEASMKGWKHADVAAITPVMPADSAESEYVSRMVKLYLADDTDGLGTALRMKIMSATFSMEESTTVSHSVGEEAEGGPEFDHAPQEARIEFVIRYQKDDYETALWANKKHALQLVAENGDEKIEITGTKVRFREAVKSDGLNDTVTLSCTMFFENDWDNGGKDVEMKITNTLASLI